MPESAAVPPYEPMVGDPLRYAPGRYEQMRRVAVGDWECKDCGSLVIDREAHDRFHALIDPPNAPRIRVYKGKPYG